MAYLIDQLKHPDEVLLLRRVYRDLFYLIGVFTSEDQRRSNLRTIISAGEAEAAMARDRRDEDNHGQQLDKTLKLSDFFLRNNISTGRSLEDPLRRFVDLVHGNIARTPTADEYAMNAAYAAALRSACLSRQVGAAITDASGNVIATGCNDVPRAGGGLYSEADRAEDKRCVHLTDRICFNDKNKDEFAGEIKNILTELGVQPALATKAAKDIRSNTRLRDLLEFSRSVHAEMDALVSIARRGGPSVQGGSLYTTTFPCHNCARHIVAAGISRVLYIEPYEKSLAIKLHKDAILSDAEENSVSRVNFLHFEGVAPRMYQDMFIASSRKDNVDGVTKPLHKGRAHKTRIQYLDSYRSLESKVVEELVDQGISEENIAEFESEPLRPSGNSKVD